MRDGTSRSKRIDRVDGGAPNSVEKLYRGILIVASGSPLS